MTLSLLLAHSRAVHNNNDRVRSVTISVINYHLSLINSWLNMHSTIADSSGESLSIDSSLNSNQTRKLGVRPKETMFQHSADR